MNNNLATAHVMSRYVYDHPMKDFPSDRFPSRRSIRVLRMQNVYKGTLSVVFLKVTNHAKSVEKSLIYRPIDSDRVLLGLIWGQLVSQHNFNSVFIEQL